MLQPIQGATMAAATRRLGGYMVQRAKGQRRLWTLTKEEEEYARKLSQKSDAFLREVEQNKEELYDMITKAERSSKTASWPNLRLLQHLSAVITPRPHDTFWDHVNSGRRLSSMLKKAGLITLPFMVSSCWEHCRGYLDEKNAVPAMAMKEELEENPA